MRRGGPGEREQAAAERRRSAAERRRAAAASCRPASACPGYTPPSCDCPATRRACKRRAAACGGRTWGLASAPAPPALLSARPSVCTAAAVRWKAMVLPHTPGWGVPAGRLLLLTAGQAPGTPPIGWADNGRFGLAPGGAGGRGKSFPAPHANHVLASPFTVRACTASGYSPRPCNAPADSTTALPCCRSSRPRPALAHSLAPPPPQLCYGRGAPETTAGMRGGTCCGRGPPGAPQARCWGLGGDLRPPSLPACPPTRQAPPTHSARRTPLLPAGSRAARRAARGPS